MSARSVRRRRNELAETKLIKFAPPTWDETAAKWRPTRYTIRPSVKPFNDKRPDNLSDPDKVTSPDCPIFLHSFPPGAHQHAPRMEKEGNNQIPASLSRADGGRLGAATTASDAGNKPDAKPSMLDQVRAVIRANRKAEERS